MTSLTNFIDQWQKDALASVAPLRWCVKCDTREQLKEFAPYCSLICQEAAKRAELLDRR